MIVLRTIAHGVWTHAGVRFTEWLGAAPLLGIGYVMHLQTDILLTSPSFAALAQWATEPTWVLLILTVGLMRLVALAVNGSFRRFRYSPTIRFTASCFAAMFWTLFTTGIFVAWRDLGGSPTGIVAYGTLIILEIRNAFVSRVDMTITREMGHAGTDR